MPRTDFNDGVIFDFEIGFCHRSAKVRAFFFQGMLFASLRSGKRRRTEPSRELFLRMILLLGLGVRGTHFLVHRIDHDQMTFQLQSRRPKRHDEVRASTQFGKLSDQNHGESFLRWLISGTTHSKLLPTSQTSLKTATSAPMAICELEKLSLLSNSTPLNRAGPRTLIRVFLQGHVRTQVCLYLESYDSQLRRSYACI